MEEFNLSGCHSAPFARLMVYGSFTAEDLLLTNGRTGNYT